MIKDHKLTSSNMSELFGRITALLCSGVVLKVDVVEYRNTRSLAMNRKMWACLGDVSKQVEWPINGRMQLMSTDDWKDVLTASLRTDNRVTQGVDGGFVVLGQRTSKMTIKQMSDLIEVIYAFGARHGVKWSEPVPDEYLEYANYES